MVSTFRDSASIELLAGSFLNALPRAVVAGLPDTASKLVQLAASRGELCGLVITAAKERSSNPPLLEAFVNLLLAEQPRFPRDPEMVELDRTVLELDLAGQNQIVRLLDSSVGANGVRKRKSQIRAFIDDALGASGGAPEVIATTGDGAIVAFKSARQAHEFARVLHSTTQRRLAEKLASARRRSPSSS